ncbi:erythromycin biosynthesis sensory transduction protein eryC1 [Paenibacillus sp. CAA11]|uniref:DegT/DnrJ/EryC1/StrS family aminotransferase n=1 Tax=Paenibacillus sp. CAA11 TaxID=1532905 RepID=UPI000D38BAA3|nr:DegT/DnrJ/EryC1/StrS family aminotransferase [Paenibacillus sp. CAA11]AWB46411.1 erythromycin biosynthesis sensory transduction protein eryC1 [Paenibacillus sp. CAA11]
MEPSVLSSYPGRIPALDLTAETQRLKPQLMAAIEEVLDRGTFIMGPNVKAFEQEAADYLGVRYAVSMNSGTDALVIALLASGIGPGDEVITSPFTFFATAEAVSQVGAVPVFVDVEPDSFNLNPQRVEEAITPRTKAILPVHLFGQPADMNRLTDLAEEHGLRLIEDAAQAFGARWQGRMAGSFGDAGCFSFFPSKNLGAFGDGGLLVTDQEELAERAAMLRTHGSKKKYMNESLGYNSRLDELQAAILRIKLPYLDEWNQARREAAGLYRELLQDVEGVLLPSVREEAEHVYHQFTLRVQGGKRDELKARLDEAGIGSMIYYPLPVHQLPVYRHLQLHLPVAEQLSQEVLSIPIWPHMEEAVQAYVAGQVQHALQI